MSSGKLSSWRLMSPVAVLVWVVATLVFAAGAYADASTDRGASEGADHQPAAQASSAAQGPTTPAPDEHASDKATSESTHGTDHGGTSGDVNKPQPISNADANTGGANGQCPGGPYCSTRDGSASANGNGGGNATGKPCAGCVGKADNKNPHGQMPNASDANAGYECDTNHGIAKGNPAHTACQPTPPPPPPPPPPPVCTPAPCAPPPSPPVVSPPVVSGAPNPPTTAVQPQQIQQVLPSTGAPAGLAWMGAAALASILVGASLLQLGRRPRSGRADA
jgi:hypothetical protein